MTDLWSVVHAERAVLAADLAEVTDKQRATPSLCTGLTVRSAALMPKGAMGPARSSPVRRWVSARRQLAGPRHWPGRTPA